MLHIVRVLYLLTISVWVGDSLVKDAVVTNKTNSEVAVFRETVQDFNNTPN